MKEKLLKHKYTIIFVAIALLTCLAMVVPAVAHASTLTVTNALNERIYTAYLVLDRDTSGNFTISKDSELYSHVKAWAESSEASGKVVFTEGDTSASFVITDSYTSETSSSFSQYLMDHINEWSGGSHVTKYSQTASSSVVTFNNVEDGFYLVQSSAGMTGSMVTVRGTGSINEKNAAGDLGTVTFDIDGDYLCYGETVGASHTTVFNETFTTTSSGTFKVTPKTTLRDFSSGHTCFISPSVASVSLNGSVLTPDVDYTTTIDDFSTYIMVELKAGKNIKIGDSLVVNYTFEVSKYNEIASKDDRKNTVYGCLLNDSTNEDVSKSEDSFGTLQLDAHKLPDSSKYILQGASFRVYKGDSTSPMVFTFSKDSTGYIYNLRPSTSETGGSIQRIGIIPMGIARIYGLGSDTYRFEEVEAPEGYNELTETVDISLTDTSVKGTYNMNAEEGPQWVEGGLSIINHKGIIIPATGGVGTLALILVGCGVVVFAVVLSVRKRHQNKQMDMISD